MSKKTSICSEERSVVSKKQRGFNCSVSKYVPMLLWLPKYSRLDAVSDLVAGITLGLTMIPQSMGYAALAGLTAQYGLYSSFIGGFLYIFFGTIKEVSIGPTSLMALLTLEYTRDMPTDFVVLLCFLAGCVELIMGVLNLGFIVDFISIPVSSGFMSATSIIIIVSQLQGLLGLRYKSSNIIDNLLKLFRNIENVRFTDLSLGLCSIAFLLIFRKLKDVDCSCLRKGKNESGDGIVKKILWFLSISRNAIIVLTGSVIAFHMESKGVSPFVLSGKVKSGLPDVSLPPFSSQVGNQTYTFYDMCKHYGPGMLVVPLVGVLTNVAIAKAFASGAAVNASQEMLTLGFCNILGSLVSSMPTCGAFTRSAVSNASGIRTPLAGLYSGTMTLLALSFLTPYFYFIPRATLSAVLISAVLFMIDWKLMMLLWKGSKKDAVATTVTFLVCTFCGVEIGLFVGALFSLAYLLRPSVRPKLEVTHCKTQTGNRYVMLKPESNLYYPGVDFFCSKVCEIAKRSKEINIPLILNCERFRSLDYTTIKGIERLSKDINTDGHRLWFLNVKSDIVSSIEIFSEIKYFHFIEDTEKIDEIFYESLNAKEEDALIKVIPRNGVKSNEELKEISTDLRNVSETTLVSEQNRV